MVVPEGLCACSCWGMVAASSVCVMPSVCHGTVKQGISRWLELQLCIHQVVLQMEAVRH